ncbi:MAG: amidase [Ilumatobacteraceae bacterium]
MIDLERMLSVSRLATEYRRRRQALSPVDVTDFFLDRVERIDPKIKSMVTVTPDLARRQAAAAARRIADGDPSPLLGVPMLVKDLVDVAGVRTTAGSAVLCDNVASRSAQVWQLLERAGAILLGKANTHEFAYGGTTEPTVNPWDTKRLVGGSSGGPAAGLAAGLAPLALGTDTAGSVRIPANLCGVVGLKPTNGTVSARGVIPLAPSLDIVGPMGHHPDDLAAVMKVIGGARFAAASTTAVTERSSGHRLRFGYLENPGPMSPGVQRAFEDTIAVASRLGTVERVRLEHFGRSVFVNFTLLGVEAVFVHEQWADRRELYSAYVRERLEQAALTNAVDYERARRTAATYRATVDEIFRDIDVLVVPGVPFAAPKLGATTVRVGRTTEDRDTAMCRNTGFANVTGHPALALPAGSEQGLPVGVQLVAARGADADLLAVGGQVWRNLAMGTVAQRWQ